MNRDRWKKLMYGLTAALLLSACSQDEPGENSTALPEGEYPLQIGSVTLTAEVSEQPWTRVSENPTDGMSSVWKDGDRIGVRIGDNEETGIYVMNVDAEGRVVGVTPEKAVYWKDKQPATITAWYPVKEELDFTHQDQGLTYLLQATGDGNYQSTPINLNFTHQLAKVRVELTGTKSNEVQQVYVRSYPTSTHSHGTLDGQDKSLTPQYVPMREATYNGVKYWEANLREGYLDANNSFQVANADGVRVQVKQGKVNIEAGHVHTIKIDVGEAQQVTGEISDDNTYIVSGTRTEPVNIIGGNPTIYLENANINITNNNHAINIQNGNPTIYISGTNNISVNEDTYGAGIYVAENSSVTITGTSEDDVLVVTGGSGGSGIGGYTSSDYNSHPCGDITIENITVRATSNKLDVTGGYAAAIGACGDQTVESITISNAVVYANGGGNGDYGGAGIGGGVSEFSGFGQREFDISIVDSEIHVSRGCPYASYIGAGGTRFEQTNYKIIPSAKITNSTIYNESGAVITQ